MLKLHPADNTFLSAVSDTYEDSTIIIENNHILAHVLKHTVYQYNEVINPTLTEDLVASVTELTGISLTPVQLTNILRIFPGAVVSISNGKWQNARNETLNCLSMFLARMLWPCDVDRLTNENLQRFKAILRNQAKLQTIAVLTT